MKIVITGKAGSGKTTLLKSMGLPNIFIADEFVKQVLYVEGTEAYKDITNQFPNVSDDGKIDTSKLGKIVFNNKEKMDELNKIVQPYIAEWIKTLPEGAIVELATYINFEDLFKDLFNKVILITRKNPDISDKFGYLDKKNQPINDSEIKYNHLIENDDHIGDAVIELKSLLV